jgi:hypothetical protein
MVGDVYRLSLVGQNSYDSPPTLIVATSHWRVVVEPGAPINAAQALIAAAAITLLPAYRQMLPAAYIFNQSRSRQEVLPPDIPLGAESALVALAGLSGISANAEPNTCAAVIRLLTGVAGRRFRGRTFTGPQPRGSAQIGAGVQDRWGAAQLVFIAAYGAELTAIQTDPVSGGVFEPVVYSRRQSTISGVIVSTRIIASFTDPVVRTQRRREIPAIR